VIGCRCRRGRIVTMGRLSRNREVFGGEILDGIGVAGTYDEWKDNEYKFNNAMQTSKVESIGPYSGPALYRVWLRKTGLRQEQPLTVASSVNARRPLLSRIDFRILAIARPHLLTQYWYLRQKHLIRTT
jgi:hypothetical protein